MIAIENLRMRQMMRSAAGTREQPGTNVAQKRGLNRAISRHAWSLLRQRLEEKAATCGVLVVAVDPRHTSQTCQRCGTADPRSRESQARFHCRACGHEAHADVNAANNILAAGLAVTARGGTLRHEPCEARTTPIAARAADQLIRDPGPPDGFSRREEVKRLSVVVSRAGQS